jgi:hypothetical protein
MISPLNERQANSVIISSAVRYQSLSRKNPSRKPFSAYKQNQQELLNNSRNTLCGQGNMDLIS